MNCPIDLIDTLKGQESFLITTHVMPDGDGIGSMLALAFSLRKLGKQVSCVLSEETVMPPNLRFLRGTSEVLKSSDVNEDVRFDVAVILDAGDMRRTGTVARQIENNCKMIVNVDHHITNDIQGDHNWIRADVSSTGEMMFDIISAIGVEIDASAAECLYTAISTDTGSFSYSNTTSTTLDIAAELVRCGASPSRVYQEVYERKSYRSLKSLAECILGMRFECGGLVSVITVTYDNMVRNGVTENDIEGFISYARSIDGVEVAISLRELADGRIRVSLRSKKKVDVAQIALKLGGGGHVNASGCTLDCPLDEAYQLVADLAKKAVFEAGMTWTE